jgi:hypothetical protein
MINGEVAERFTSGILPSALRAAALSRGVRRRSKGGGLDGSLLERFQTAERSDAGPTGAPDRDVRRKTVDRVNGSW